jgi:hypothetical protein
LLDGVFELSHLTRSRNQLWSDLLANLEGSGSNLTLSEAELIAAARNTYGGSISAKTTSRAALIASLVNAAGGSADANTQSEDEMLAALATALGAENWSANSKSGTESLAEAVAQSAGAGDWWDAGTLIHIDLVGGSPQGRAWVNGVGEVNVDTLLGDDANTENAWAATDYNPLNLGADGYLGYTALIGTALTTVLAGSTIVLTFKNDASDDTAVPAFGLCSADGVSAIFFEFDQNANLLRASSYTGSFFEEQALTNSDHTGLTTKLAMTLTPARAEVAESGSAVIQQVLTTAEYPVSGDSPIVAAFCGTPAIVRLSTLKIYTALPTTAGLSELSE